MPTPYDVLIVPGSVREKEREFRAIAAGYALNKKLTTNLLLSGGKTSLQTEAQSILKIIKSSFPKIATKNIYLEENSLDTSTNIINSIKIINKFHWKKIGILTNNYHLERTNKLAKNYGIKTEKISADDLLIEFNSNYKNLLKNYYLTTDMRSVFIYENLLNKLLIIDHNAKIPQRISQAYYSVKKI